MKKIGVALLAIAVVGGIGWGWRDWSERAVRPAPASAPVEQPTPASLPQSVIQWAADRPGLDALFIGDSITNGTGASDPTRKGFAALLRDELDAFGAAKVETVSRPGLATAEIQPDIPAAAFDLVFVEVGTNDESRSTPDQFRSAYPAFIDAIRQQSPDAMLICLGPWLPPSKAAPFSSTIESTCENSDGIFVNISGRFEDESLRSPNPGQQTSDMFHPNDKGHEYIVDQILGRDVNYAGQA